MVKPIKDTWFRVVGITLLMALVLASDDAYQQTIKGPLLIKLLVDLAGIILTWHLNRAIILYYRTPRAIANLGASRWVITFVTCAVASTLLAWVLKAFEFGMTQGTLRGYTSLTHAVSITLNQHTLRLSSFGLDWLSGLIQAAFYGISYGILFFVQEVTSFQQRLDQSEQEKEQLRIVNLQSQLAVLKQQVNPHFLFNSLNSLSSLIQEDPAQAERFVDKLSEVYRYVLRANEQDLTTLESELQFIDAYYHLLQTRYGRGLSLSVAVDTDHRASQLPPLTLQLLVENAVKHNIVSPKQPLAIHITSTKQTELVVSNSLQRKKTRVLSNGVGLTNIVSKYSVLNLPLPAVAEAGGQFIVTLPLLTT